MREVDGTKLYRLFYPMVAMVISARWKESVGGMPAINCMTLSFNPPLVGLSAAPGHHTHALISKSGCFAVNWLGYAHADKVAKLAQIPGRDKFNKLMDAGFTVMEGKVCSVPLLKEAMAGLECKVKSKQSMGGHDLFVTEALRAFASKDFQDY